MGERFVPSFRRGDEPRPPALAYSRAAPALAYGFPMQDTPWLRWLAIALAIIIVLIIIAFLVNQLSGDEAEEAAGTTTTLEATTTSLEETTTTLQETTTTVEETTTTVEETTTTVEETTTTEAITDLVLADDGIGGVDFGATPEETIVFATAHFGPPDVDTGWIDGLTSPYGVCPEPDVRGVEWGTSASGFGSAFTLLFTNGVTTHVPAGGEHFFGYYYFGGTPFVATVEGITYNSTNSALQTEIPSAVINEDPFDPTGGAWFSDLDPADQDLLWGFTTTVTPTGTLTSVNGGSSCGE